ncbi:hypothetical protein BDV33DRAFT_185722 [Aspergillus novoparasiticus]|uniref:Uncharacterized protein n=1 Tax=Aspergillus novoparasiticus TaxID=986946 RepID=A0A5N6E851_9EURO|nr:hypothetical protein BDV33DRAFT_185722 [Aspergillus novoparasiticus]
MHHLGFAMSNRMTIFEPAPSHAVPCQHQSKRPNKLGGDTGSSSICEKRKKEETLYSQFITSIKIVNSTTA